MSIQCGDRVTPEEYLYFESKREDKNEYVDGRILARPSGSLNHNRIIMNLGCGLHAELKGRDCSVLLIGLKVSVPEGNLFLYPDILAFCGEPRFLEQHIDENEDILLNPIMVVEVLSPFSEAYDRGKKFLCYQTIETLMEYILIAQDECKIEHFTRQPDSSWFLRTLSNPNESLELITIGCQIRLSDIYDRVEFS